MKLKDQTFAIIAEKQDSVSHKWFNDNVGGTNWAFIGQYYVYSKGNFDIKSAKPINVPIYTESEFEALLKEEQDSIKDELVLSIEANEKITADAPILTDPQIEGVISWMNTWEQLRDTAIPMRFKEDFTNKLKAEQENEAKEITQKLMEKYNMQGGQSPLSGKPKELTEMPTWQKIVSGSDPKQITISYDLAIEYIAERLNVDKGIIKIEMP